MRSLSHCDTTALTPSFESSAKFKNKLTNKNKPTKSHFPTDHFFPKKKSNPYEMSSISIFISHFFSATRKEIWSEREIAVISSPLSCTSIFRPSESLIHKEVEDITGNTYYSSAAKQLASNTSISVVLQHEEEKELRKLSSSNGQVQKVLRYHSVY